MAFAEPDADAYAPYKYAYGLTHPYAGYGYDYGPRVSATTHPMLPASTTRALTARGRLSLKLMASTAGANPTGAVPMVWWTRQ